MATVQRFPARAGSEADFLFASQEEDRLYRMRELRLKQLRLAYVLLIIAGAGAGMAGVFAWTSIRHSAAQIGIIRQQKSQTEAELSQTGRLLKEAQRL